MNLLDQAARDDGRFLRLRPLARTVMRRHFASISSVLLLAATGPSEPAYPDLADVAGPDAACDRWVTRELRDVCVQMLDGRRLA